MENKLLIRITGTAKQVFQRIDLMARLAGPKLTLGEIDRLSRLNDNRLKR